MSQIVNLVVPILGKESKVLGKVFRTYLIHLLQPPTLNLFGLVRSEILPPTSKITLRLSNLQIMPVTKTHYFWQSGSTRIFDCFRAERRCTLPMAGRLTSRSHSTLMRTWESAEVTLSFSYAFADKWDWTLCLSAY